MLNFKVENCCWETTNTQGEIYNKSETAIHKYQQKLLPLNKDQIAGKSLKLHHASYEYANKTIIWSEKNQNKVKWHETRNMIVEI